MLPVCQQIKVLAWLYVKMNANVNAVANGYNYAPWKNDVRWHGRRKVKNTFSRHKEVV